MNTVGQNIAAVRGMLNAFGETEVPHSDEFIYLHLKSAAATYMRQRYDKTNVLNFQNFRFYSIPTERADLSGCGCVGACQYLQTKDSIPEMLMTRGGPLLFVRTLDHVAIPYVDFSYAGSLKHDEVMAKKIVYSLINKKIVLHNTDLKRPKAILVGGYAVDSTQWLDVRTCNSDGGNEQPACSSLLDAEMTLDADVMDLIYTQTVQKLRTGGQPSDRTNEGGNPY